MLNLGSSVSSDTHSLQQFRFYGNNANQSNTVSSHINTMHTSHRGGSRVKSVGFGRHLAAIRCREDRMLTRRSLEQLKPSSAGSQAAEPYNPDLQCSSVDSSAIKAAKKDESEILTSVSLNQNSVFNWLCSGRPSIAPPVNSLSSNSNTWRGDKPVKKPTLPLGCCDSLQKSPCSLNSDSCNDPSAQLNVAKTSPLSCGSSNTQSSDTSCKSKTVLRSKLPRSLSFADCSKLNSWRRTSNLTMPESPGISDVDLKEFPQDLPRSQSSATITLAERPKRVVTMKKAESVSGLSWKEEVNLRKALMASMRSSSRSTGDEDSMDGKLLANKRSSSQDRCCGNCDTAPVATTSYLEDSNDGSSSVDMANKVYRGSHVRAQRKFAASPLSRSPAQFVADSPVAELSKKSPVVHKSNEGISLDRSMHRLVANKLLNTEDFLTYLCIRSSPKLPPHLEIFSNDANSIVSSCPSTPTNSSLKNLVAHGGSDSDLGVSVLSLSHETINYLYKLNGSNRNDPSRTAQLSGAVLVRESQHTVYSSWNQPLRCGSFALSPLPQPIMTTQPQSLVKALRQKPDRTPSKRKDKKKLLTMHQLQMKGVRKQSLKQKTVPRSDTEKHCIAVKQLIRKPTKSSLISKAIYVKKAAINMCTKSRLRASTQAVRTAVEREQQIMDELRAERSQDTKIRLGVKRCYMLKSFHETGKCESKKVRLIENGSAAKTLTKLRNLKGQNLESITARNGSITKKGLGGLKMKVDGKPNVNRGRHDRSSSADSTGRSHLVQNARSKLKRRSWLRVGTPMKDKFKKKCQAGNTFRMAVKQKVANKRVRSIDSSPSEDSIVKKNKLRSQEKARNEIANLETQKKLLSISVKNFQDKDNAVSKSEEKPPRFKFHSCAESSSAERNSSLDSENRELTAVSKSRETVKDTKCRKSLLFNNVLSSSSKPAKSVTAGQLNGFASSGNSNVLTAPTFYPTAEQFSDLIAYIESIKHDAASYGMCRIIPPANGWKVDCNIPDSLRFVSHTQYIHRLKDRWGPNVCQTACIQQHIEKQASRPNDCAPLIGGIETDLANLLSAVETCGGLERVIDSNKWSDVVKLLHLPKAAREKTTRLYEIFCRYLLPYSTLSREDRQKLEGDMTIRKKAMQNSIVRKKTSTLSEYFCIARNAMSMYFDEDPVASEVERVYWDFVNSGKHHVTVQTACIEDTAGHQRCSSSSGLKKHSLHSLQRNSRSVLHYLDRKIAGVTLPVLNVAMLFSTRCWSVDKHLLPAIHYIHTGADVIWHCVPQDSQNEFKKAMVKLVPESVNKQSDFWLNSDTAMVSPQDICSNGNVKISRVVQQQGELIVVLPQSMVSTIGCGYSVSEHVNYCSADWIPLGCSISQMMYNCRLPEMFSMDELLTSIAQKDSAPVQLLQKILPYLKNAIDRELNARAKLIDNGVQRAARWNAEKLSDMIDEEGNYRCHHSNQICYLSVVVNESNDTVYCVERTLACLQRRKMVYQFRLFCRFTDKELLNMLSKVQMRINSVGSH